MKTPSSSSTHSLLQLPAELLELSVCAFLDAPSLTRLSSVNRALHREPWLDRHWKAHVTRTFGLASAHGDSQAPRVCWKDVFVAAWLDARSLSTAQHAQDVLQILHTHPTVLLSQDEDSMRQELVLMQGLQRFPMNMELIRVYAQCLRSALALSRVAWDL